MQSEVSRRPALSDNCPEQRKDRAAGIPARHTTVDHAHRHAGRSHRRHHDRLWHDSSADPDSRSSAALSSTPRAHGAASPGLRRVRLPIAAESGAYGVAYGVVAHALGLKPTDRRQVRPQIHLTRQAEFAATGDGQAVIKRIEQGAYANDVHDFAVLERLIADPTQPVNNLEQGLLADEGRLVTYAGRMVDGLARAITARRMTGRTARRVLGDTIAALPDDAFTAIGEKLLGTLRGHWFREAPMLYIRLGDLGLPPSRSSWRPSTWRNASHAPAALGPLPGSAHRPPRLRTSASATSPANPRPDLADGLVARCPVAGAAPARLPRRCHRRHRLLPLRQGLGELHR